MFIQMQMFDIMKIDRKIGWQKPFCTLSGQEFFHLKNIQNYTFLKSIFDKETVLFGNEEVTNVTKIPKNMKKIHPGKKPGNRIFPDFSRIR